MKIEIHAYNKNDIPAMTQIWNEVVNDGVAFPQTELLSVNEAAQFFASQTHCAVARDSENGDIFGLYILHPNNVGRCGHIGNASYAVASAARGRHIGRLLVEDSLAKAKECGFRLMQFNAVVAANIYAQKLYESLGFIKLGTIPGGFLMKDGHYEDIILYYCTLYKNQPSRLTSGLILWSRRRESPLERGARPTAQAEGCRVGGRIRRLPSPRLPHT